jgi:hypothetical protein
MSGVVVSVMNERLQQLAPSANRPNGTLPALALDRAHPVCGELSAAIRFEADRNAPRQGAVSIRPARNGFPLHGETHPHRISCRMPVKAAHGSRRCKELTPKTTESHWLSGQREP